MKPYKGRELRYNQRVRVYRNLNRGGYSVLSWEGPSKGLVVAHCDTIALYSARFIVQKSGWLRFWNTGTKNVHAYVEGNINNVNDIPDVVSFWHRAVYNPCVRPAFQLSVGGRRNYSIIAANHAVLREEGIRVGGAIELSTGAV